MNTEITSYFDHPHNATLTNERGVELVLGFRYIDLVKGELIEVGAVTPYYRQLTHICLDPVDPKATVKDFAENYDFTNKNVLSISTIEHIGRGDYRLEKNEILAFNVLNKIYDESKSCLITWPIGYNKCLDNLVKDNLSKFNYFFYVKRSQHPPHWEVVANEEGFNFSYGSPFGAGNSAMIISKGI